MLSGFRVYLSEVDTRSDKDWAANIQRYLME